MYIFLPQACGSSNADINELTGLCQLLLLRHAPPSVVSCDLINFLLRDLLTTNVFIPMFESLRDPSFICQSISSLFEDDYVEGEDKQNNELKQNNSSELIKRKEIELALSHDRGVSKDEKKRDFAYSPERKIAPNLYKKSTDKTSIPVALSEAIVPSAVMIVKPIPVKKSHKSYDVKLASNKWNKKSFLLKSVVDGINEEEYFKSSIGLGLITVPNKQSVLGLSKSRPASPHKGKSKLSNEYQSCDLSRSRSWSDLPSLEVADEATCSFIEHECDSASSTSPLEADYFTGRRSRITTNADEKTKKRRKKRHLVKMNSFDNNDATTDCFNLPSSFRMSSLIKSKSASDDLNELTNRSSSKVSKDSAVTQSGSKFYVPIPHVSTCSTRYRKDIKGKDGDISKPIHDGDAEHKKVPVTKGNSVFFLNDLLPRSEEVKSFGLDGKVSAESCETIGIMPDPLGNATAGGKSSKRENGVDSKPSPPPDSANFVEHNDGRKGSVGLPVTEGDHFSY